MAKTILITGANGWIGYNAQQALGSDYQIIPIDAYDKSNPSNRFGMEGANLTTIPQDSFIKMDLASPHTRFDDLIKTTKPDCVIHLAGVLENQSIDVINTNLAINQNVLPTCIAHNIPVIAASSIMVMYGAAMLNAKIRKIFEREPIKLHLEERLTVDAPFQNTEASLKLFDESCWETNLGYIKTKESLEHLSADLTDNHPDRTIVAVRFGWAGVKNPYEVEDDQEKTQIPICLDQDDLQNFLRRIVASVLNRQVTGFKKYVCTSLHPQNWADVQNAQADMGWVPKINIKEKFSTN